MFQENYNIIRTIITYLQTSAAFQRDSNCCLGFPVSTDFAGAEKENTEASLELNSFLKS